MSEFDPYEPIVPTNVQDLELRLFSRMVDELGLDGLPTGNKIEKQSIVITATVTDQLDNVIETNEAKDNRVVAIGLISQAQKDQLQALLDELRVTAEGRLLPTP